MLIEIALGVAFLVGFFVGREDVQSLEMIRGRQWCLTCGKETQGAYYCSEACYPPEEEE